MAEQQEAFFSISAAESLMQQYGEIRDVLTNGIGQVVQNAKGAVDAAVDTTEHFVGSVLANHDIDLNGEIIPLWKKQLQELSPDELVQKAQTSIQDAVEAVETNVVKPMLVESQSIARMFEGEQLSGLFGEAVKGLATMGVQVSDPLQGKGPGVARGEGLVYGSDSLSL